MSFDLSANFSYTGTTQYWDKPLSIKSVYFIVKGGGGAGSDIARGGGGAYVFSTFNFLNGDISYNNVIINVGGGGKAPPTPSGGVSTGGTVPNVNGFSNSYGGFGSTYNSLTSGGGGGLSSVIFMDACGNQIIKIIAGGGGGGGTTNDSTGGNGSKIGVIGNGLGGGQGGNSADTGNAGLGGGNGGVNGYNYRDNSNNGIYNYIGGGGGSGGTYGGGGGGSGYGGGAGGRQGGGGGGGSYATYLARTAFIAGGGGSGGLISQDAENGSIQIFWNSQPPEPPPPIISMLMLNAQRNCQSAFNAPILLPPSALIYQTPSSAFSNSGVIGADNEVYIVADDGALYAFDHSFTFLWAINAAAYNCTFRGTPVITGDGALYIAGASATSAQNYFFSVVDTGGTAGGGGPVIKWQNPPPVNGQVAVSPIIDLSGTVYTATDQGTIYSFTDYDNIGTQNWQYTSPDAHAIINPLTFDNSYNKLAYTTFGTTSANLYVVDLSSNPTADPPVPRWGPVTFTNERCNTPAIDISNIIYLSTNSVAATQGQVYAIDISNGDSKWLNPVVINDVNLSAMAIDNVNKKVYCTSRNALNVIDSSNGVLEWSYQYNVTPVVGASSINSIPLIDASYNVYFGGGTNYVHSVNTLTRRLNWKYKTIGSGGVPGMLMLSDNNNLYFGANDGRMYDLSGNGPNTLTTPIVQMYMLNPQHTGLSAYYGPTTTPTLRQVANFNASNLFVLPALGIGTDGTLYIGTNNGYLNALNPGNLSLKWSVRLNNATLPNMTSPNSMYTTPAIGFNGTIYIGSNEGNLYAVNPLNGSLKWVYRIGTGYPLQSSPMIDSDGNIYFGAGQNVYSLGDAGEHGFMRWLSPFATNGHVNSSPALGQNGFLYFGSDDGFVYAINSITGLLQWKFNATEAGSAVVQPIYTSATVDASNNVIIGNGSYMDGTLYYLDGVSLGISDASRTLWTCKPQASLGGPLFNTVAVKQNTIYLATIGKLYAINRLNGLVKWTFVTVNCYYTSPIIDASGTIFVASLDARTNNGKIHALTDNGSSVVRYWPEDYDTGQPYERLAPPVLGSDGTIYMSSTVSNNNSALNATNMRIYAVK
jgi:outer membrane protein assembly factor BamB